MPARPRLTTPGAHTAPAWCASHELPCLHARPRRRCRRRPRRRARQRNLGRRAAIRYLHLVAGLPVPTAEARVAATLARAAADACELLAK